MTRDRITRGFILTTLWLGASATMLAQSGFTYDRSAEVAVSGTILAVVSLPAPDGAVGVHIDLQTPTGLVNVHIAPAMFIGKGNFWFFAAEEIEVIGTPMSLDGNNAFLAKAIQKGSAVLTLRSADGAPKWSPAIEGTDGCGVNHAALPRGTER
jgi:hypothetical protein